MIIIKNHSLWWFSLGDDQQKDSFSCQGSWYLQRRDGILAACLFKSCRVHCISVAFPIKSHGLFYFTFSEQAAHGGLPQSEGGRGRGVHLQEVLQGPGVRGGHRARGSRLCGQREETQREDHPQTSVQRRQVRPCSLFLSLSFSLSLSLSISGTTFISLWDLGRGRLCESSGPFSLGRVSCPEIS